MLPAWCVNNRLSILSIAEAGGPGRNGKSVLKFSKLKTYFSTKYWKNKRKWVSPKFSNSFVFQAFQKFVETGRIAYIADGELEGKLVAIVNIIDQNRVS